VQEWMLLSNEMDSLQNKVDKLSEVIARMAVQDEKKNSAGIQKTAWIPARNVPV
jgi:hypothetical protein